MQRCMGAGWGLGCTAGRGCLEPLILSWVSPLSTSILSCVWLRLFLWGDNLALGFRKLGPKGLQLLCWLHLHSHMGTVQPCLQEEQPLPMCAEQ